LGASQLGVFASLMVNMDRKAAGYPSALLPSRAAGVGLNKTSAGAFPFPSPHPFRPFQNTGRFIFFLDL